MTDCVNVLSLSNSVSQQGRRRGKKKKAVFPLQMVEFWVHWRTSGLENSVGDDYQKWVESKGASLLLLSFSPS